MSKCKNCDKILKPSAKKFCSVECHVDFAYKEYIARWLAEEEDGVQKPSSVSDRIRRYLKETRGDSCELCNWDEVNPVTGNVPVQVEHSDGNYLNNRPENLKLICPNCHSLTPTFGSLN